ncbi:hypothetical protein EHO58_06085 [Leptospira selangorensis]|uniref:LIC_10461 domain-containing protein n=1 Tax=Leptospira selangorensis TaxID=2484982 RepID=UPI00108324A2|nr:hypothetical protein [Leptospira selangorensis]TGK08167.1 hypothetical protein EHO58_06085 [Leptospira selangorensis]
MLQVIKILILVLVLGLAAGCHTTTVVHKGGETPYALAKETPGPDKKAKQGSTVFGIYPTGAPMEASCDRNHPEVIMKTGFVDLVIHALIGPFYTTKTVEVYCKP